MSPKQITLYSQPDCPPCDVLKSYLVEHGIPFEERDITRDPAALHELASKYQSQSTPTTVIGDQVMIGLNFERLEAMLRA